MLTKKTLEKLGAIFHQAKINSESNTDERAYDVATLYDYWPDIPEGKMLKEGKIVRHSDGILYKVLEPGHAKQSTWSPDVSYSLFSPIHKSEETGTIDNPYTWVSGMESEKGKYYLDEGIIYLCIESSGIGLYAQPKDLPRYFQKI